MSEGKTDSNPIPAATRLRHLEEKKPLRYPLSSEEHQKTYGDSPIVDQVLNRQRENTKTSKI